VCQGPSKGEILETSPPKGKTLFYNMPIPIEKTRTVIKAMARAEGLENSAVHTCLPIFISSRRATFEPDGGKFTDTVHVRIGAPGAEVIYYTLDGTEPDESSAAYRDEITIASTNITIRAVAKEDGKDLSRVAVSQPFLLLASPPEFHGDDKVLTSQGQIFISCRTPQCAIYYTTDGSVPHEFSPGRIADGAAGGAVDIVKTGTVVKAVAVAPGRSTSEVAQSAPVRVVAAAAAFDPDGGSFVGSAAVHVSSDTVGASIYYTVDGSEPTETSRRYTEPIPVESTGVVVKAIAMHPDMDDSDVTESKPFTVQAAPPTFDPTGGTFTGQAEVQIQSATAGAQIRCTTNGDEPTEDTDVCMMPVVVTKTGTMIKAVRHDRERGVRPCVLLNTSSEARRGAGRGRTDGVRPRH
jgi:hypothetical protein